ncbi:LamG domain-containing protein, partial [Akkermansiaceae bacterium]|nr:LamG domain-containing protein [Akkermansiaceae bacterium]
MKLARGFLARLSFVAAFVASSFAHAEKPSAEIRDFKKGVQQIFEKHCYECHGREKTKGKVDLTKYATWADLEEDPELIEEMIEVLDKNEMPPAENGFNNRGDHLSLSPVLMESFLELSRSIVHAENFDENCGVWHDLFDDPLKPESKAQKASISVDRAAVTGSTGLTVSAWIRPTNLSGQWQTIVRREDSWRRQLLAIGRTGKIWGLWMGAGIAGKYEEFGAAVDPKILADGKWHHVAGTIDGKKICLYLDGKEIGSKPMAGKLYTQSTGPMSVGAHGNEPFYGDLNDVRLFRSGLGKDEIQSIASGDKNVANDDMMGSWSLP